MEILAVDLPAFERGDARARRAVVDGVRRSLETGFVYARHDLPAGALEGAYELLGTFFRLPREAKERCVAPGAKGQTGYTGTLVETAVGAERADWKEMLNWGRALPDGHPLRRRYPHLYPPRVLPEAEVPGITEALALLYDRLFDLQQRFLRIVALGLLCHEAYFDSMVEDGATLARAIRYPPMAQAPGPGHVWAAAHGDINLVTALPRATSRGLQVEVEGAWVDAVAPDGHAIVNTGLMLERLTNGAIPTGVHRVVADPAHAGERLSVVQFCHPTPWTVLAPLPTCVSADRPPRYPALAAGDWLEQTLHDIKMEA